jgi:hypothetical protein
MKFESKEQEEDFHKCRLLPLNIVFSPEDIDEIYSQNEKDY